MSKLTAKVLALEAIDRVLGMLPKSGAMTELDTNIVRYSLGYAREAVDNIEELKNARPKPKAAAKEPTA